MIDQTRRDERTIAAVATPHGHGGISVIRLSGRQAREILSRVFSFRGPLESHYIHYGFIVDPSDRSQIDEVLVSWFDEGRSFTGEPTAEISCHGNPLICDEILRVLVSAGALPADRGEFTYRAFMNGRIDLAQAEGVLSMIESRVSEARRQSLRQLKGELSASVSAVENNLVWSAAQFEVGIDFSAEGLDVVDCEEVDRRLKISEEVLARLAASYKLGRTLRDGVHVAIVGRPNVGKSSLFNLLTGFERAIVTDIPGTTRDLIETEVLYQGTRFVFVDTAGMRDSEDPVEALGVKKSRQTFSSVDLLLFVVDGSVGITDADRLIFNEVRDFKPMILFNKTDLCGSGHKVNLYKDLPEAKDLPYLEVSAKRADDGQKVLGAISSHMRIEGFESTTPLMRARHFELVNRSLEAIRRARAVLARGDGGEFAAVDLKEAVVALHELLGKRFDDQIMDRVFSEFCIGK